MITYQISPDCLRIDLNADEAQELLTREGSIPSQEWAMLRPAVKAFARSCRMVAAYKLIEEQKKTIQELEERLAVVTLQVHGDIS